MIIFIRDYAMQAATQLPQTSESKEKDSIYDIAQKANAYARSIIRMGYTQLEMNRYNDNYFNIICKQLNFLRNQRTLALDTDETLLCPNRQIRGFEESIKFCEQYFLGNCTEFTFLAFDYCLNNFPGINAEVYRIQNGDHNFLVLNRKKDSDISDPLTWGEDAYICDPWANKIIKATDFLKIGLDGKTQLQNYFKVNVYHLPLRFNLSALLPKEAYETTSTHHILRAREIYGRSVIYTKEHHPLPTLKLDPLFEELKNNMDNKDEADLNLLHLSKREHSPLIRVRFTNHTESINLMHHHLVFKSRLNQDACFKSQTHQQLSIVYNKKLELILAAVTKFTEKLTSRLEKIADKQHPKYLLLSRKVEQLHLLINTAKEMKLEEEFSTSLSYKKFSNQLRSDLRTVITESRNIIEFKENELAILKAHRKPRGFRSFFGLPATTPGVLVSAATEFNTSLNQLKQ